MKHHRFGPSPRDDRKIILNGQTFDVSSVKRIEVPMDVISKSSPKTNVYAVGDHGLSPMSPFALGVKTSTSRKDSKEPIIKKEKFARPTITDGDDDDEVIIPKKSRSPTPKKSRSPSEHSQQSRSPVRSKHTDEDDEVILPRKNRSPVRSKRTDEKIIVPNKTNKNRSPTSSNANKNRSPTSSKRTNEDDEVIIPKQRSPTARASQTSSQATPIKTKTKSPTQSSIDSRPEGVPVRGTNSRNYRTEPASDDTPSSDAGDREEIDARLPAIPDFSGLTDLEKTSLRSEYTVKIGLLRKNDKTNSVPKKLAEDLSLEQLYVMYKKHFDSVLIHRSIDKYRMFTIVLFLGMEWLLVSVFKFEYARGYAKSQIDGMDQYEMMLYELGEKNHSDTFASFSPEVRLLIVACINAAVFVLIRFLASKIGTDKLNEPLMGLIQGLIGGGGGPKTRVTANSRSLPGIPAETGMDLGAMFKNFNIGSILGPIMALLPGSTPTAPPAQVDDE